LMIVHRFEQAVKPIGVAIITVAAMSAIGFVTSGSFDMDQFRSTLFSALPLAIATGIASAFFRAAE
jgi:FtsH-binding integral membrane protein